MSCPSEDDLVRMIEGELGDASLASLEAHVDECETCAAVIASLGALAASGERRRVGRYQLDRRIAFGGMGEVWAAWDPQLRRDIAVKIVRPDRGDQERERERLMREARALARLTHPNVLAVYDVGEVDGEVFIATELVIGDTLATRTGANVDWRTLAGLYAQAARGLAAAHAAGLVHRDVKPANLLLGSDGRVRVADFGLAVPTRTPVAAAPTGDGAGDAPGPSVTATGAIAGTPAYMAPEQRAGGAADARVDQYALCIALAEALAGRRPPPEAHAPAALVAFVAERRSREPGLDVLRAALARGLAIDPAARFPDATALADAIDALLEPTPASPPPALAPRTRSRAGLAIAAIATAAGIGAIVVATRDNDSRAAAPVVVSGSSGSSGSSASSASSGSSGSS
ncbi:MAG: serine/threonine-protein kinase, partial [Kofleriaceae bacterium]